jgi:hypothetical protein
MGFHLLYVEDTRGRAGAAGVNPSYGHLAGERRYQRNMF